MKYIKTDTNIFELVEETEMVYIVKAKKLKTTYSKSKIQTNVLGTSDSLEDLCDVFVVEKPHEWSAFRKYAAAKKENGTCYGAIRTDKGFIYVAKTNDKGELYLL